MLGPSLSSGLFSLVRRMPLKHPLSAQPCSRACAKSVAYTYVRLVILFSPYHVRGEMSKNAALAGHSSPCGKGSSMDAASNKAAQRPTHLGAGRTIDAADILMEHARAYPAAPGVGDDRALSGWGQLLWDKSRNASGSTSGRGAGPLPQANGEAMGEPGEFANSLRLTPPASATPGAGGLAPGAPTSVVSAEPAALAREPAQLEAGNMGVPVIQAPIAAHVQSPPGLGRAHCGSLPRSRSRSTEPSGVRTRSLCRPEPPRPAPSVPTAPRRAPARTSSTHGLSCGGSAVLR